MPFFAHLGMIYVPLGAKAKCLSTVNEVHGGSAWGAGAIAGGDGSRQPSAIELEAAEIQGLDFGTVVKRQH
jgi:NAD(P)H dehydrogenase (quinone)